MPKSATVIDAWMASVKPQKGRPLEAQTGSLWDLHMYTQLLGSSCIQQCAKCTARLGPEQAKEGRMEGQSSVLQGQRERQAGLCVWKIARTGCNIHRPCCFASYRDQKAASWLSKLFADSAQVDRLRLNKSAIMQSHKGHDVTIDQGKRIGRKMSIKTRLMSSNSTCGSGMQGKEEGQGELTGDFKEHSRGINFGRLTASMPCQDPHNADQWPLFVSHLVWWSPGPYTEKKDSKSCRFTKNDVR